MPLSWNEIKTRALAFSKEWENTEREEADAKPFLVDLCYQPQPFTTEAKRIEYLFELYDKYTSGAAPARGLERYSIK